MHLLGKDGHQDSHGCLLVVYFLFLALLHYPLHPSTLSLPFPFFILFIDLHLLPLLIQPVLFIPSLLSVNTAGSISRLLPIPISLFPDSNPILVFET